MFVVNMVKLVLFALLVHVATCFSAFANFPFSGFPFPNFPFGNFPFSNVRHNDGAVVGGQFSQIDPSVNIKGHPKIGDFTTIRGPTEIGDNCQIGNYVKIADRCTIADGVKIFNFATIGAGTKIGTETSINEFATVGTNANIGNRVKVMKYAVIGNDAVINDDCIIDAFSPVGSDAQIGAKAYVGKFASIPSNANVNALAIIHAFVSIQSGYTVKSNEVIIRAPSTYELYQKCAAIATIPNDQIQIASDRSSAPSKRFNDLLRNLLDATINNVKENCARVNSVTTPNLSAFATLFLIQRYGLDSFKETYENVRNALNGHTVIQSADGAIVINGFRIPPDYHFLENYADGNVFEPDVKKKFVQLLEIEEDSVRTNRVKDDTFCLTTTQILNGLRVLSVTASNAKLNTGTTIA